MECREWRRLLTAPTSERLGHVVRLLDEIAVTTKDSDDKEAVESIARQVWTVIDRMQVEAFPVVNTEG